MIDKRTLGGLRVLSICGIRVILTGEIRMGSCV